tara:strand:- start:88948 stop:89145 length:198 start_codon:yes stop_codon:yes gene_type:complete
MFSLVITVVTVLASGAVEVDRQVVEPSLSAVACVQQAREILEAFDRYPTLLGEVSCDAVPIPRMK